MLALRYAAVLALAVWVGGLLVLGMIVAPTAFDVLSSRGADGRTLAGAVFGEVLRRFHLVTYVCSGLLLLSLAARGVLGPRPRRFAIRVLIAVCMTGATVYTGMVVMPRIAAAQKTLGVPVSTLPESDPRRVAFGRLHGLSTSLELIPLAGGLILLLFELKD